MLANQVIIVLKKNEADIRERVVLMTQGRGNYNPNPLFSGIISNGDFVMCRVVGEVVLAGRSRGLSKARKS